MRGGASTTTAPTPPPQAKPTPPQPAPKKRKFSFESSDESDDGAIPRPKRPKPPHRHHHRTAYEARPRPQTHQPPQDRHHNPPHQDRHPQGCREEGRLSRGYDHRDGRPRTLPQRGREGHRPWYPRAEERCRLGGIPGRHHPLPGEPLPPLPHPRGGPAARGRGPGGGPKGDETPHPQKRNA